MGYIERSGAGFLVNGQMVQPYHNESRMPFDPRLLPLEAGGVIPPPAAPWKWIGAFSPGYLSNYLEKHGLSGLAPTVIAVQPTHRGVTYTWSDGSVTEGPAPEGIVPAGLRGLGEDYYEQQARFMQERLALPGDDSVGQAEEQSYEGWRDDSVGQAEEQSYEGWRDDSVGQAEEQSYEGWRDEPALINQQNAILGYDAVAAQRDSPMTPAERAAYAQRDSPMTPAERAAYAQRAQQQVQAPSQPEASFSSSFLPTVASAARAFLPKRLPPAPMPRAPAPSWVTPVVGVGALVVGAITLKMLGGKAATA